MSRRIASRETAGDPLPEGGGQGEAYWFHWLRYSHIFASLVREILEVKFLREISPQPLALSQFHLLKVITLNGDHQIGEMATVLGVSPPAITKIIDKLEQQGLIVRSPSKGDRRATLLSSSEKGRRLVQDYEGMKTSRLEPVLQAFSAEELLQFAEYLKRFSLLLIEREDAGGGMCLRCAAYCEEGCPVGVIRDGCPYQKSRDMRASEDGAEKVS